MSAKYISIIQRKNIFKTAVFAALILNIDRIILGSFSLIRIYDVFDTGFLFPSFLRKGFSLQLPQILCGVNNLTLPIPLGYILSSFFLPSYINYLLYSVIGVFIAFAGMFLLLHDEFELSKESSFIGALFFSSFAIFSAMGISITGIPFLIWSLERLFDNNCSFRQKIALYLYTLFYFINSIFVLITFPLLFFYCVYFLFFSKIKKNARNVLALCLIWSLYVFINFPSLTQLFYQALNSHRNSSYYFLSEISWMNSAKFLVRNIFDSSMQEFFITIPSLPGLFILIYYFISPVEKKKNKEFLFFAAGIAIIEFLAFFIYMSPLWNAIKRNLGFMETFQFQRVYFLTTVIFSILIAMACDSLIVQNRLFDRKRWFTCLFWILFYTAVSLILHRGLNKVEWLSFSVQFFSLFVFLSFWLLRVTKFKRISAFQILLISFSIFLAANTLLLRFYPSGINSYYHFFSSPQIEEIKRIEKNNIDNFRVVKIGGFHPGQLLHNGFQCADGYLTLYPQAYKEFWAEVLRRELDMSVVHRDYFLGWGNRVYLLDSINKGGAVEKPGFNLDLLKLINVKYLFSDKEVLNYEKYNLIRVAEASSDYSGLPVWKRCFRKSQFYVYENKDFAPRVFLTDLIKTFKNKEELLSELSRRDYAYLKKHSFVLKNDLENVLPDDLNISGAEIKEYKLNPDRVEIRLNNEYPLILNWTRNFDKFWSCKIDGRESRIFRIYNSFMGVIVPAHSQKIEFEYRNIYFSIFCFISLAGFFIINIFLIRSFKRARA